MWMTGRSRSPSLTRLCPKARTASCWRRSMRPHCVVRSGVRWKRTYPSSLSIRRSQVRWARILFSFVGTNNKLGGVMAGETLAKLLDGKGNVVLLRYREDCASTRQREEGFLETIKKHPDIQVLADDLYAGGMAAEAQASAI